MTLLATLLCSLLRGARLPDHRVSGVLMLTRAAVHCDEDTKLQRIIPYVLAMIGVVMYGVCMCVCL